MEPTYLETLEILKASKSLFENNDAIWTGVIGALGVIGGVIASYVPNKLLQRNIRQELRKSTAFQIYAEIKATLEVERYRGYIRDMRQVLEAFDSGTIESSKYVVQISDDRYIVYKSNLANIGLLPPKLQAKIVLFYQLIEAIVQDIKPGGLLNSEPVGRKPFAELLEITLRAKSLAEEILAECEKIYPDIA